MRSFFPTPAFDAASDAAAAAAIAAAAKPWIDTIPPEAKGYIEMRGLAGKKPEEIALAAIEGHREAAKVLSYPQNEIVRVPKDLNDPAMKNVWQRLGAPNDAAGYDFSSVKRADGTALDEATATAFRNAAFERSMPKDMAVEMAKAHVKLLDSAKSTELASYTAAVQDSQKALKTSWGTNFDSNMIVAKQAAAANGIKPETIIALEKSTSYAEVMEFLRVVGTKTGEGRFVTPNTPGQNTPMTKQEAKARRDELMSDQEWKNRYLAGGKKEFRENEDLIRIEKGVTD